MSFQSRNDRREGYRIPVRNNNINNTRQEWVPRGGGGGGEGSTGILETPPPPTVNSNPNWRNVGNSDSNYNPAHFESRPRGNFVHQRSYVSRPVNSRKENDGKTQVAKNPNTNSSLPQLVQEIQEKLMKGTVECMICYDMVRRSAPIWSCSSCFSIFHLNCIKKWARAPTSVDLSAEKNQGLNWRCPGCQSVQLLTSKELRYICFCGKRPDPPSDLYLTPHSCGEPCGKPLEKQIHSGFNGDDGDHCPHLCVLQCHPGPCPPCKAFAPARSCPCGKKMITTRCSDRKSVLTCGQRCNKVLECGRHHCKKICHTGPCEPCAVPMNAACFCKKKMEVVLCGEMAVKGELIEKDGVFSCNSICSKTLVCGNHTCGEICHPGSCGECELMPWKIKSCYCGKTRLQNERKSCLDPIPTCSNTCGKTLPCQIHRCKDICHVGDCSPCLVIVNQKCRCGSSSRTIECYKTMEDKDKFCCEKPCGRKKNCGRHRCSERCCPLSNSSNRSSGDWDPHLCSMICGKKLRCGQHSCESLCHSGHCPPCLETIFTDLTCACGKTSIPPPLPCGTPPPSCQHPCSVPQPCGHSSSHGCHFGDCPPCSVPVAKECIGGHVVLRNIPCGSKEIRCNQLCGKTRQCGMHACGRTCHPPPCDSSCGSVPGSKSSCGQICGAPRRDCRHTCTASCHPAAPCPDLRCDFPVTITCSCGRITATVPCDAGGNGGGFTGDTVFEASVIQKLPVPLQPVEANGKKISLGQRKLVCDDDCVKMERKRVLADAFDITTPNLDALHFGENSSVSDQLADLFRQEPKWVLSIEERFKFLVLGKSKGGSTNGLRVHVFCPMLKEKRDAVRQIAERWKLSVHAAGWEPKRFLVVHVTPKSKAPARVLGFKGSSLPLNSSNPPAFDPLVDMDQRLVVALLDLPRDADVSALVLRFGGECELVWLNDKNALAVFSDPARAATALRRLDHGSVYQGAVVVYNSASSGTNAWVGGAGSAKEGGTVGALKTNAWKKAVVQEPCWGEDSWGIDHDSSGNALDTQNSVWKGKEGPITASKNRYNVLDQDSISNSASASSGGIEIPSNNRIGSCSSSTELKSSNLEIKSGGVGIRKEEEASEVVDDWEKAYE
ncbi:zinc finger protein [Macleaya cordata]|uniref:Zinc finger protein n=1 Tax=Macleaya cordata TaxID=56857 RepID=A0A200PSF0_MACCD|nr:zinc finger protein [Macleaya cordata]